jgi:maltose alpha-D-glucosyltransferase / alpha-amylase
VIEELRAARWFGGKSRAIRATQLLDRACWVDGSAVSLVKVEYESGPSEAYVVADRLDDADVARALLKRFEGASIPTEAGGTLEFQPTHVLDQVLPEQLEPIALLRGEQSNTSIRFGNGLILKLFRRVQFGPNPDVEVGWFLTEHSDFRGTPPVAGSLTYVSADGSEASLAMLQGFVANRGDAWTTTLSRVRRVLDGGDLSDSLQAVARLGQTTAELHLALARGTGDFAAETIDDGDVDTWRRAIHDEVAAAAEALSRHQVEVHTPGLLHRADGIEHLRGALKTRHHGDYHLGQILEREDGSFVIIDFEGEPAKPLAQRREKRSPLRDVAGMLRSFDYARHAALRSVKAGSAERAHEWYVSVRSVFLRRYCETARQLPRLLPQDVEAPLAALELEKAAYEVLYELNNRPDWLPIPLAALTSA